MFYFTYFLIIFNVYLPYWELIFMITIFKISTMFYTSCNFFCDLASGGEPTEKKIPPLYKIKDVFSYWWTYETISKYVSRAGFEPPLADETSYEANALPTKPPRLDLCFIILTWLSGRVNTLICTF